MNTLPIVKATNVTNLRKNIKRIFDQVTQEHSTYIVTRTDAEDVILMSESEYEEMIKRINNLNYTLKLSRSIEEMNSGDLKVFSVDELEDYE